MRLVRILGKLLLVLLIVLGTALALVYWRSSSLMAQHIDVKEPALLVPTDADAHARGEHLAVTRGCTDCHDKDLGGKVLVDALPIGRLAAPNLTRGKGGVGTRLDATSIERAVRHGLGQGGRLLLYMPATDYAGLADADIADLIAYVSSVPAVDRESPGPTAGPLMRTHHSAHMAVMTPSATPEYGRYIAQSCTGCHGEHFAGGHVPGTPPSFPDARNITPAGIGKWSKQDFYTALRTGKRPDGSDIKTFMPWKAFATMTDIELDALWAYLQTVPPVALAH
jgi:cytochrome c553